MKSFLSSPVALVQSPHKGTYQTQSGAIQGILADMYDSFRRDLAGAIDEETERASDFAKLDATNKADLALMKSDLNMKELSQGNDVKDLATEQKQREETQAQLDADEAFFETTKESCKAKADEWAERSRLRTEELAGMNEAIDILTSDEATATFATADSTFIQMSSKRTRTHEAMHTLAAIAAKTGSKKVAELVEMKGNFPEVEMGIVRTIEDLRKEEQEDIDLKAWCEGERSKSSAHNEQLEYDKTMTQNDIDRKTNHQSACDADIRKTEQRMAYLQDELDNALANRNEQNKDFKEDLEKEIEASKKEEQEALAAHRKMLEEGQKSMQAMKDKIVSLNEEIADTGLKIEDQQAVWDDLHNQKLGVDKYLDSIKEQCDWIMTNFDSRATARKEEMEGLERPSLRWRVPPRRRR